MVNHRFRSAYTVLACIALGWTLSSPPLSAGMPESQRLERAKDLIAEEQWVRAMQELKAAADDPREANRDEALFWLAHSQNQARDALAAVDTIGRLERGFPKSRWLKPAQSLRLEIAQRLGRFDVLWHTARPAPPTAAPAAPPPPDGPRARPGSRTPRAISPGTVPPPPAGVTVPAPEAAPPRFVTVTPAARADGRPFRRPTDMPPPTSVWVNDHYAADTDLRIQALGSLIRTDAPKVIPMLKEIALSSENPGEARRALFVLAQSDRPEARSTVVEVAKTGPEPVRLAAVRELGRLSGAGISNELLQVYSTAQSPVKYQVVRALGDRSATAALLQIAQSESDPRLRNAAIVSLGQAGGRQQLSALYARSSAEAKRPIIVGLFNAQADAELIRIAERERDRTLRQEILTSLRLLGTPLATQYLQQVKDR